MKADLSIHVIKITKEDKGGRGGECGMFSKFKAPVCQREG
jgi:hypothetical protein